MLTPTHLAPDPTASKRGPPGIHTTRYKADPVDVRPFDVRSDPLKAVQLEGTLPRGSLDTTVKREEKKCARDIRHTAQPRRAGLRVMSVAALRRVERQSLSL